MNQPTTVKIDLAQERLAAWGKYRTSLDALVSQDDSLWDRLNYAYDHGYADGAIGMVRKLIEQGAKIVLKDGTTIHGYVIDEPEEPKQEDRDYDAAV